MGTSNKRRSATALVGALSAAALGIAGCSSAGGASTAESDAQSSSSVNVAAPTSLVSSGELTYGVAATFAPYEYKDGDALTGFDVDMASSLAELMGLEPSPLDMDFDGLIPALQGGRVDIINSAMYINDERSAQVDFVPYMLVGEAMIVPAGNPLSIEKVPDDLSGKTIAVTRGAIGETYMNEFNEQLKEEGKDQIDIMALPSNQDALMAVSSGRADGFDTSTAGAAYTTSQQGDQFSVAATFKLGTKIGIAVKKGDEATKSAIESALNAFVANGGYAELMKKYNLPDSASLFN
jgi:polar amino acid transport system substrate-binding protein